MASFNGEENINLMHSEDFSFSTHSSSTPKYTDVILNLLNTGVTAGQYSAVNVDAKGRVTAGGKSIEWGTSGQTTPSNDLMIGGLFMELQ